MSLLTRCCWVCCYRLATPAAFPGVDEWSAILHQQPLSVIAAAEIVARAEAMEAAEAMDAPDPSLRRMVGCLLTAIRSNEDLLSAAAAGVHRTAESCATERHSKARGKVACTAAVAPLSYHSCYHSQHDVASSLKITSSAGK